MTIYFILNHYLFHHYPRPTLTYIFIDISLTLIWHLCRMGGSLGCGMGSCLWKLNDLVGYASSIRFWPGMLCRNVAFKGRGIVVCVPSLVNLWNTCLEIVFFFRKYGHISATTYHQLSGGISLVMLKTFVVG